MDMKMFNTPWALGMAFKWGCIMLTVIVSVEKIADAVVKVMSCG